MSKRANKPLVPVRLVYCFTEYPPKGVWDKVMKIVGLHQQSLAHTVTIEDSNRWIPDTEQWLRDDGEWIAYSSLKAYVPVRIVEIVRMV